VARAQVSKLRAGRPSSSGTVGWTVVSSIRPSTKKEKNAST
jgi:hypothetical protein